MNAINAAHRADRIAEEVHGLQVAACGMGLLLADRRITYSEAVDALCRLAIRRGCLGAALARFDDLTEQLEATIHQTAAEVAAEAAREVRNTLALCRQRSMDVSFCRLAAYATNRAHGQPLPPETLAWLVREAVEAP